MCSGCEGFSGMWTGWQEVESKVVDAVKKAKAQYPTYKVVATGHSLGAD